MDDILFVIGIIFIIPIMGFIIYLVSSFVKSFFDNRTESKDSGCFGWACAIVITLILLFLLGLCGHDNVKDDDYYPRQEYRHTHIIIPNCNSNNTNSCYYI